MTTRLNMLKTASGALGLTGRSRTDLTFAVGNRQQTTLEFCLKNVQKYLYISYCHMSIFEISMENLSIKKYHVQQAYIDLVYNQKLEF